MHDEPPPPAEDASFPCPVCAALREEVTASCKTCGWTSREAAGSPDTLGATGTAETVAGAKQRSPSHSRSAPRAPQRTVSLGGRPILAHGAAGLILGVLFLGACFALLPRGRGGPQAIVHPEELRRVGMTLGYMVFVELTVCGFLCGAAVRASGASGAARFGVCAATAALVSLCVGASGGAPLDSLVTTVGTGAGTGLLIAALATKL